jgi:hypothetical protein
MEFIQNYIPTSKAQLIQVAMMYNNGDLKKAQDMFDFYAKNLDLPDFDPIAPTFMQQVKTGASDLFSWIKDNQGDIVNGYQFLRSVISNKGDLTVPDGLPVEEPLAPINE